MLSKNTLFEFLYQNLHDQITCGHLKPGDTLPSMPQLAAIYNVGIRTVKDVLARLKTEGLIQTTERKPARVIYRAEKNSASQSYAVGLLRRQESLTEVYQTMGLILPSIFHFSAAHCDIKKLPSYQKLLKKNNCQDTAALDAAFSALLNELLRSSNNLLYNDLYNSLKTYSKVTLAAPKNMLFKYDPETFRLLLAALQSNDYQLVNKRFNDMYLSFSVSVNKYIRKVYKKYQQAEIPEPVYDYNWSAEKGRDHYYTQIARDHLPDNIGLEWSGLSYQEKQAGGQTGMVMALVFLFVFLFLAAQYESWTVPIAVLLSLPVAALGAYLGVWVCGLENDVYFQIGLVMLVGLAAKNAILIVEFAKVQVDRGEDLIQSAIYAAKLRFRPILMTSLAFVLGMLPMVLASGPGSASRQAIGTGVFFGMIFAIVFGIILVPFFFVMVYKTKSKILKHKK